jgi:hypothetical protein
MTLARHSSLALQCRKGDLLMAKRANRVAWGLIGFLSAVLLTVLLAAAVYFFVIPVIRIYQVLANK